MTFNSLVKDYAFENDDAKCLSGWIQGINAFYKGRSSAPLPYQDFKKALLEHEILDSFIQKNSLEKLERDLLCEALTHKSLVHEMKPLANKSYERLEFLGDTVLSLIVSTTLYSDIHDFSEGELSKMRGALVNEKTLAKIASLMGVSEVALVGKGEFLKRGHYNESVMADIVEALLGASYLTGGLDFAKSFFNHLCELFEKKYNMDFFSPDQLLEFDSKSKLQELTMKIFTETPLYRVIEQSEAGFVIELVICDKVICKASGKSKKEAEHLCAKKCLKEKLYKI